MLYKTILFIVFCVLFANSFMQADFAYAAENDNMFGFAWSETFGWIIFNSDARVWEGQLLDFGIPVSASEDDAHDDGPGSCYPDYSHISPLDNKVEGVFAGRQGCGLPVVYLPFYSGFRWTGLGLPPAAEIVSAIAKLRFDTHAPEPNTNIAFELNADPLSFSSTDSPYHRWAGAHTSPETFNLVTQSGFINIPPATWIRTPELKSGLQQIIGLSTGTPRTVNDVVLLESGEPPTTPIGETFSWTAYDDTDPDRYGAARLYVEYEDSGGVKYDFTFNPAVGEDFGIQVDPITGFFTSTNPNGTGAYAWSSNLGWIKFNPTTTPPSFYNDYPARMNIDESPVCGGTLNAICGWARVCSAVADKVTCEGIADPNAGGWDGWIYLGAGSGLSYDDNTETINGWAWGGNEAAGEGIGWISFNRHLPTSPGTDPAEMAAGGITFDTSFLTLNAPPQAVNLSSSHSTGPANCGLNYSPMVVQWDFYDPNFGDEPAAFQVVARAGSCVMANQDINSCTSAPQTVSFVDPICGVTPANTDNPTGGTCDGPVNLCQSNQGGRLTANGTVSTNAGLNTVAGFGTSFTTEVCQPTGDCAQNPDRITIGDETKTVIQVNGNFSLTVKTNFANSYSNETMELNLPQFINCTWTAANLSASPPHPRFLQAYYWTVRVKDNDEFEPAWSVFPDLAPDGQALQSFTARRHKYPGPSTAAPAIPINPLFSMVPLEPSVGEVVEFTEDSTCYWSSHAGALNQPYPCNETAAEQPGFGGGASALDHRYQWDLNGDRDFDDLDDCDSDTDPSCRENMPVTYTYNNIRLDVPVTLRVTDKYIETNYDGGGYCDFTHDVFSVFPRTIQWREISPF